MRKILPILLFCLLLAACGRQAAEPAPTAAAESTEAPAPTAAGETFDLGFGGGAAALSYDDAAAKVRADSDAVYLFATNVGKGDALILRAGGWVGLIDTGKTWARGRVERALDLMGAEAIDAVFLTHTDDDHTGGLKWMAADGGGRTVGALCASAMYTGVKASKHDAAQAAEALGLGVKWLKRGDEAALPSGATLKVLAPASLYQDKDDNNSLVLMLESAQGKMLLAGDMELPEEAELLGQGDDLKCDVLKVANHGDDDTTSAAFASACAARIAVISTSGEEKPGTPDPGVVRRLEAAGSRVVVTEDSELGVLVTLKGGVATVNYVDFGPSQDFTGLTISEVDASDDRIALKNDGGEPIGLGGCYLYSDKGDELYAFWGDVSIEPGATLTVGTNSTSGSFDLLWDDKKVINKKKTDVIWLYDAWGRVVDWRENGL